MEYLASAGMLIGIYVILAASYNLIIGYGGLNTIAHPIFFALGAYTAALLGIDTALPSIVCVLAGIGVAVVASIVLAVTTLRIAGDYLLIASLGFQLGLLQLVNNFEFTGGPAGLSNIPVTITGPGRGWLYLLICAVLAIIVVWLIRRAMAGPFGRAVRAMRDDELAFAALGRSLFTMKIVDLRLRLRRRRARGRALRLLLPVHQPRAVQRAQSATILTMVVLGGIGTTWGPLVGAFVLEALPQAITFLQLPSSLLGPLQGIIFTGLVHSLYVPAPARPGRAARGGGGALMGEILRLENLCKQFGGIVVADDISLTLAAGEILGLIGPNGAGKTSLFNLVSGVVQPDSGRIFLQGRAARTARCIAGRARAWSAPGSTCACSAA